MFLDFIDNSRVDKSTEIWLDAIEDRLDYEQWFCGHYHTNKTIDRLRFLYEVFFELKSLSSTITACAYIERKRCRYEDRGT